MFAGKERKVLKGKDQTWVIKLNKGYKVSVLDYGKSEAYGKRYECHLLKTSNRFILRSLVGSGHTFEEAVRMLDERSERWCDHLTAARGDEKS